MPEERGYRGARRTTQKLYSEQPLFEMCDYENNPALIKRLHEDVLSEVKSLKVQLETVKSSNHTLELQNKEYKINLDNANSQIQLLLEERTEAIAQAQTMANRLEGAGERIHAAELQIRELEIRFAEAIRRLHRANWRALLQSLLTIIATVILSIGVNTLTSKENIWVGGIMIFFGVSLEVIAFLVGFSPRPER